MPTRTAFTLARRSGRTALARGTPGVLALLTAGLLIGCDPAAPQRPPAASSTETAVTDHPAAEKTAAEKAARPSQHTAHQAGGHDALLPNLHLAFDGVYSGGMPAGEPAFDELRDMGIRTIICVDGATPDVKAAESRGMRYVHIPLKYAGITAEQQAELSRAVRDLPRPIYIHCHHGKHRSPAAAAMAGIGVGAMSDDEGTAFLKTAGTGKNYAGLWACVGSARALQTARIDAAPAEFPPVAAIPTTTHLMLEIDDAFSRLQAADAIDFAVPAVRGVSSVSDAAQIADHLRAIWQAELKKSPAERVGQGELGEWCRVAADEAQALEDALAIEDPAQRPSTQTLHATFAVIADSCSSCHAKYRN